MALSQTQVSQLYVAIFNRASEGSGNTFWQGKSSVADVANEMLATSDAQTYFGGALTDQAFIELIYQNTLAKSATDDPDGIAYWVGRLDAGDSRGQIVAELVAAVGTYADAVADGTADAATVRAFNQFNNRVEVSNYTADNLQAAPADYATSLNFGADLTVTDDDATVATAQSAVDGIANPGETFTLTTSVDTLTGTANNDTFVGIVDATTPANSTLTSLDSIDGGAGNDTLSILNTNGALNVPTSLVLSSVETVNVRSANAATIDTSGSGFSSVENVNVTQATSVTATGSATQDISISGVSGAVDVAGGADVTVNHATAGQNINVGESGAGTTNAAGTITVTDTNQGAGNIAIDGGTDVTANNTNGTGTTIIGANTQSTGAVDVNTTLTSTGAALAGGATTVNGGSTIDITVDATNTADAGTDAGALSVGAITANAGDTTSSVNVAQNLTNNTFTSTASGQVTESASVKFGVLKSGDALAVGGLTFTASKDLTAAEVAQAFSGLTAADTQDAGGPSVNGTYTGALSGFTSASGSGDTVVFTSTTAASNVADLSQTLTNTSTNSVAPVVTTTAGAAGTAAATSTNTTTAGAVRVDESAVASVTNVTVDTYASADLGNTGNDLDALTTLSLSNSAGAANVATAATTLALNVNNVDDAVSLDLTGATIETLNLTAAGAASAFALTSAATTDLNVTASADLDLTGSTLTALENTVVTGAGDVTLGDISTASVKLDASAATGDISATVDGTKAVVTTGTGDDSITVDTAAISKAINLGAGDDTLTLSAATAGVPTAAVAGGAGTDTIAMTSASAQALDGNTNFATAISGFERLTVSDQVDVVAGNVTIDLAALGFSYVTSNGTVDSDGAATATQGNLILDKMANNGTLVLNAGQATTTQVNVTDAATGTADVLNLVVSSEASLNAGTVTADDVETINVAANDIFLANANGDDTNDATHTLTVSGDSVESVVVTGDDLTLTTNSNVLTSVDASAMTGGITYSANSTAATTVTGGAGSDALTAVGSGDTLIGGAGNDTLTGASLSQLTGGAGNDTFVLNAPSSVNAYSTITDAEAGDTIDLGAGTVFSSNAVELAGTAVFQDYANQAINDLATGEASWFQFGGNTFVIADTGAIDDSSFNNGQDSIVQITGVVDLSTASYNETAGTLEIA